MAGFPPPPDMHPEMQRGPGDYGTIPHDIATFARIEGLVGEEHALLQIPARERTREQDDRLHHITTELDRIFEHLRERAERIGRHRPTGDSAS
jgi:hypothetical protein